MVHASKNAKLELLLVDDRVENLLSIEAVLGHDDFELVRANSGAEALRHLLDHTPALILMDVQMPGLDGFETVAMIKSNKRTRQIPIIFVTAIDQEQRFVHRGYEYGAVDYIHKPYDPYVLRAKVKALAEIRRQHERIARLVAVQQAATRALAAAVNVDDAIAKILASLCRSLKWELGTFWRLEPETTDICAVAQWQAPDMGGQLCSRVQTHTVSGEGLVGEAWALQRLVWRAHPQNGAEPCSNMALPLLFEEQVMGVLEFSSTQPQLEDADLAELLESIGSQIGQFLKRDEAMQMMRASDSARSAILDTALDAIISIDHNGSIVEFNRSAERLLGHKRSAVIGRELADVALPKEMRGPHRHGLKHYLATGESKVINQRIEVTAMRADGTQLPVELSITRVPGVSPPVFTGFMRDITQLRRVAKNSAFLAEASSALSSSLKHEEICASMAKLAVTSFADWCAVDMLGSDAELLQGTCMQREGCTPSAAQLAANKNLHAETVVRTGTSQLFVSTTEPWYCAMTVPLSIRDAALGALTLVSYDRAYPYDVDDLHLAEELGRRAAISIDNARLYREVQDAVSVRDEFFSIASHELKTPLTSLKLTLQVAQRGVNVAEGKMPSAEKLLKMLSTSNKQVNQLAHLVEDMLDIVKINAGRLRYNFEKMDLSAVVLDLMEQYSPAFDERNCAVTLDIQPHVVGAWDRIRMEQVLVNLLSNIIKYAPGKPVKVALSEAGETVRLVVQDAGPGIPAERRSKIFKRFERGCFRRDITGLGLGLFIVKQVVEAHAGTIRLGEHKGPGTTFVVEIPLRPLQPASAE